MLPALKQAHTIFKTAISGLIVPAKKVIRVIYFRHCRAGNDKIK
jgi:hypothetical protein